MPTLFDKLWTMHRVGDDGFGADLLAIDRVFLHERTGGVALKSLIESNRAVLDPSRVYAVMDHIVSFRAGRGRDEARSPGGDVFITQTRAFAERSGINLIDTDDRQQGIIHVVGPELGLVQPGYSVVCPDSHTCSLGALGALSIGVGSSEVEHALATGVTRAIKPKQMRIRIDGSLKDGVSAKDIALHIISEYGASGGKGHAIEYCGTTIEEMDIEARLTLCNLAVEFAAFTAVIAPDEKTKAFINGRDYSPTGENWEKACGQWRELNTDPNTSFDHEIIIKAAQIDPMITWGTSPEQASSVYDQVPDISSLAKGSDESAHKALEYMGLVPGQRYDMLPINGVFIGSCTNGRLSDLRSAANILNGHRVAPGIRAVCVPGSQSVRTAAEAEGLDQIFKAAGFEWGAPGCAMCFYAGGETFPPQSRIVSSTNRNFQGRQGPGVRTHLASPATVAASAVAGVLIGAQSLSKIMKTKGVA